MSVANIVWQTVLMPVGAGGGDAARAGGYLVEFLRNEVRRFSLTIYEEIRNMKMKPLRKEFCL
jgi:hypothetical protein